MSFNLKNFLTYKILSEFDTLKKKLFLIAIIEKIFFKIDSKNVSALNKKIYVKNKKI
jgi:glycine betaine/choline ABC-type transport system substrate-binding protein